MKKVILTPNPYRDKDFQTVRRAEQILKASGMQTCICLPFDVEKDYNLPNNMHFFRLDHEIKDADFVICFGGDGTILHMAKAATRYAIPILGVNIGTMGFMAELESTELEELSRLASGDFTVDNRMMLDVTLLRNNEIIYHDICLNDVVLTKGAVARVIHVSVQCDGAQVMQCNGDGLIIATPTGSTAYSLSAGGPIVEPEARSILITPICMHDISSRSIIVSTERVVTAELVRNSRRNAFLSVDGGKAQRLNSGDIAVVRKSNLETKLIRLKNHSFYDLINMKFKQL